MEREVLAAASPAGWPPAPQNTTNSHSETVWYYTISHYKLSFWAAASALWALAAAIPSSH
jgi:hypothetical protein